jgi:radical SAM-linked protein
MRGIIKYERDGAARFISHLDMQRAFARALRRAKLPLKFSEGFNPHVMMSFAFPLSVGIATRGDYLEVRFTEELNGDVIADRLNAVLPLDIRVASAGKMEDNAPKLMSISHAAKYEIIFDRDMEDAAGDFMKTESFVVQDRKGRQIDIRPRVYGLKAKGGVLWARLANSSSVALNPAVFAGAFGEYEKITRLECFCKLGDDVIAMEALEV